MSKLSRSRPAWSRRTQLTWLSLLFYFLAPTSAFAQSTNDTQENPWIQGNLNAGLARAKESGKPLMVVLRCPP